MKTEVQQCRVYRTGSRAGRVDRKQERSTATSNTRVLIKTLVDSGGLLRATYMRDERRIRARRQR